MAEEELPQIEAIFPTPPPFSKHFTGANFERLREAKTAAGIANTTSTEKHAGEDFAALRLLELPLELTYLIPPALPEDGKYRSFGAPWNLHEKIPTLADLNIEQLFPTAPPDNSETSGHHPRWTLDRAAYLKKIVRSIMLNFLELTGILSVNPEHAKDKLADLEVLFLNAHHLINEYRPHQARESLILEMEEVLERRRAEIEEAGKMRGTVDTLMEELVEEEGRLELEGCEERGEAEGDRAGKAGNLETWTSLDAEIAA